MTRRGEDPVDAGIADDAATTADGRTDAPPTTARRRAGSVGQTIGGVLFGFEQQVLRTMPPPQELVHHARPDAPLPAADGSLIHVGLPGLEPDAEPDGSDRRRTAPHPQPSTGSVSTPSAEESNR